MLKFAFSIDAEDRAPLSLPGGFASWFGNGVLRIGTVLFKSVLRVPAAMIPFQNVRVAMPSVMKTGSGKLKVFSLSESL